MDMKTEDGSIEALKANYLSEQEAHLARMKEQLSMLGHKSKKVGTTALIVGGILLVGYIVGRKLLSKKDRKVPPGIPSTHLMIQRPKSEPAIVTMIKEQMLLFIMAVIKEKLTAYINAVDKRK